MLSDESEPLEESLNYQRSLRFANADEKREIEEWNRIIKERVERDRKLDVLRKAKEGFIKSKTSDECEAIAESIKSIVTVQSCHDSTSARAVPLYRERQASKEEMP